MTRSLKPQPAWRRAAAAAATAKPKPPEISLLDPREGSWTGSIEWGNSYEGPYPGAPDGAIEVLRNDRIVGPPRSVSLLLSRAVSTAYNADVYARIRIGSGNASKAFLCDYRGRISLVCNSLSVEAIAYAPGDNLDPVYNRGLRANGGDVPSLARLKCSALLGLDSSPSSSSPTFTPPWRALEAGQYLQFWTPDLVTRVRPFLSSRSGQAGAWEPAPSLSDFQIILFSNFWGAEGAQLVPIAQYEVTDQILANGVDLPSSCQFLTIHNDSSELARVGAVFELGV